MAWFTQGPFQIHHEVEGTGAPVLLLPGFSGSIAGYGPLRARLAASFRLIAADLPGSGRSLPQPRDYTPDYYAQDAAAFAALLDHLGTGPCHLIGHSDGGEVALLMAAMYPAQVRSVVAFGAAGALSDPDRTIRAAFRGALDAKDPALHGYREYLLASYGEECARRMLNSFAGAFDAILAAGGDISASRAPEIRCPVLLITGENDWICPPPLVRALAARIAGARLELREGAGHSVHEDQPEWFAGAVLDFLDQH